jgi:peptide deformylase
LKAEVPKLTIITYPDPRLRKVCKPVDVFDERLAEIAGRMLDLMHQAKGVGLAAAQVGLGIRLFVWNTTGKREDDHVCVNPLLGNEEGETEAEEGCLSLPEVNVNIRRAFSCTLRGQDLKGQPFSMSANELLARCWQHEVDHLDGRLIIDRMSEADKIANRRALKQLESKRRAQ